MLLIRIFSVMTVFVSTFSFANTEQEIQHLLKYVGNTNCQYERNGSVHTGAEAVKHIEKKYNYFKDDIVSAEDFIKYSATKSRMSGKYYLILCQDQTPIKSKDWLLTELMHYRIALQ